MHRLPSQLHLALQDVGQVGLIPTRFEAFGFDLHLRDGLLAQPVEGAAQRQPVRLRQALTRCDCPESRILIRDRHVHSGRKRQPQA